MCTEAVTTGTPNVPYQYQVRAQDADQDTLMYTLTSVTPPPANAMSLNSSTGLLSWSSTSSDLRTFTGKQGVSGPFSTLIPRQRPHNKGS